MGDPCKSAWVTDNVIKYVLENLKLTNPYSANSLVIKSTTDPRLQAEGQAGQSTEMGVIFVTSTNFMSEPGSEWVVGTCFKSPCVAAGIMSLLLFIVRYLLKIHNLLKFLKGIQNLFLRIQMGLLFLDLVPPLQPANQNI